MHNITLISTVHRELGKCNSDELYDIINKISPEVIFLEALDETYSTYDHSIFSSFGVYHRKLEIRAIQKYSSTTSFQYVPVLDSSLSGAFEKKYNIVCESLELQKLIDNYNSFAQEYGFKFLNSVESIRLHEEMRILECKLLNGNEINSAANEDIEAYENSMFRNIQSYCKKNDFNTAIFMCGVAHRKSIIKKIEKLKFQDEHGIRWTIYQQ